MNTIKVIVATHKLCEMPSDRLYLPVHVGATGKESIGHSAVRRSKYTIHSVVGYWCDGGNDCNYGCL